MRKELCDALVRRGPDPNMVFLTGDLGFMALEPLQAAMGPRFVNAGVSEQNMISVAAAMAKEGWQTWCYSIAPFCFARPFEQIRNDVCLHDLPVKLLGNGGGYGYGVMGPTHHAVEDYGVLLALPFMKAFVPAFDQDVAPVTDLAAAWMHPCYVRLGRGELPAGRTAPPYAPWRRVLSGGGPVVVAVGPIAGACWSVLQDLAEDARPDLWILSELPLVAAEVPEELRSRLAAKGRLVVVEEHVRQGGAASMLAQWALETGVPVRSFRSLAAAGLALGVYGSQPFLREHAGLGPAAIRAAVVEAGH